MSCKKYKKRISDELDGRLSERNRSILNFHLSRCNSCREYSRQLTVLRSQVREREKNDLSMEQAQEFMTRLKKRILNEQQQKQKKKRFPGFEKWAYSAAGFLVVIFLILYFVILQPTSIQSEEYFVLSFEDAIGEIYSEIESDPELEDLFNTMILVSLGEVLEELDMEATPFIIENPLYKEDFSEEDLKILELKMKQEEDIKS